MSTLPDRLRPALWPLLLTVAVLLGLAALQALLAPRLHSLAQEQDLAPLRGVAGGLAFDNDPLAEARVLTDARLGPGIQHVYPLRWRGALRAVVVTATATGGYGGPVELLLGIGAQGRLLGVRVRSHRETPGLGDAYVGPGSDWLHALQGLSLRDPPAPRWRLRRDDGDFDHITGATVTPRALLDAIRRVLEWHAAEFPPPG